MVTTVFTQKAEKTVYFRRSWGALIKSEVAKILKSYKSIPVAPVRAGSCELPATAIRDDVQNIPAFWRNQRFPKACLLRGSTEVVRTKLQFCTFLGGVLGNGGVRGEQTKKLLKSAHFPFFGLSGNIRVVRNLSNTNVYTLLYFEYEIYTLANEFALLREKLNQIGTTFTKNAGRVLVGWINSKMRYR